MRITAPLLLLLPMLAAGCASTPEGEFPSLAKRPYEDNAPISSGQTPALPIPGSLPAGLAAGLSSLEGRVRKADAAFRALLPATRQRALNAKGSAQSSGIWVGAHIALSRLDRARADAVAAASELDVMITNQLEEELTRKSPPYSSLMTDTQQRVDAIIATQNSEIDRLGQTIGL